MSANDRSIRIGPITLFTFIAVLCLATLAVLSVATANASWKMADLQGKSMEQQYAAESAAQDFVAQVEGSGTADLPSICKMIESSHGGVTVSASADGDRVNAEFACESGRILNISIVKTGNGSYEIEKWNMTAIQNSAEAGKLWTGN